MTAVNQLKNSIELILEAYAKSLTAIAKGEVPTVIIDEKLFDRVIKVIQTMEDFERFDKIANPEQAKAEAEQIATQLLSTTFIGEGENPMESRSKVIKEKLNGVSKK